MRNYSIMIIILHFSMLILYLLYCHIYLINLDRDSIILLEYYLKMHISWQQFNFYYFSIMGHGTIIHQYNDHFKLISLLLYCHIYLIIMDHDAIFLEQFNNVLKALQLFNYNYFIFMVHESINFMVIYYYKLIT